MSQSASREARLKVTDQPVARRQDATDTRTGVLDAAASIPMRRRASLEKDGPLLSRSLEEIISLDELSPDEAEQLPDLDAIKRSGSIAHTHVKWSTDARQDV